MIRRDYGFLEDLAVEGEDDGGVDEEGGVHGREGCSPEGHGLEGMN